MSSFTFRVIQQRWNMNAVRLPVSAAVWKRDGQAYLDRVAAVVALANAESLVVVLAAQEDRSLPSASDGGFLEGVRGEVCENAGADLRAVQRAFDARHRGEHGGGRTAPRTGRCGGMAGR